ncbi:leucine-rich repeat and guanylate kinase domain-containing protein-like [Biomphalaria glabrata]|uniref:Leucine-rich repeat and guanylate kinase domain-containing protein-like n=1 Tax=Biomphalaria glabrata TaxID=6526 RepID=A0A9U8EGY4_BIOGL|nr:leucine-rich repeat and guanylate kinase domain-containing protein-like [Biomphalaria glabrata]
MDEETDILKVHENSDLDVEQSELILENENLEGELNEDDNNDEELSPGGVLDEETIARGLSNLGRSAHGEYQVYLNVTIPGFSLVDISLLGEYQYLQKVEVPYNDITDLSPLGKLPHLLILDASHNQIEKLLDFTPPFNLQEVNFSWNKITEMGDLSSHYCLHKLLLDNNEISGIFGLEHCRRLKYLSMSHNHISKMFGLDELPIQYLNLSNNQIRHIENLETLKYLRELNLSGNNVRSLSGLSKNTLLEMVDLEDNEIIDIVEINHIKNAKNLRELNLLRNPIQELPDYRLSVLFRLNRLVILDRHHVKEEEKVSAVNMFDPPMDVVAARDHIMHVVYSFLQPARIWDSTLPSTETPYPMLVLVGPQGSGKKELAMNLVDEFGDYFGFGVSHTTRRPRVDEIPGKDYYFVSLDKFETDIKMGQFIQTYQHQNNWFGLQMESIENVARDGHACVVHMELEGVMTLKKTFFEPRYVLVTPLNPEIHERRLRQKGIYSEEHIKRTLKRVDLYVKQNQEHPGFFDMMICSDDITVAYKQIQKIVMDYLGISPEAQENYTNQMSKKETPDVSFGNIRARTWSRPSNSESLSQSRGLRLDSVGHGIVEEESIKRRQSAAKDVVNNYVPPLYDQLMSKYPKTAPQMANKQIGLGHEQRAATAPTKKEQGGNIYDDTGPADSPDSSSVESSVSRLSDLDSAAELEPTLLEEEYNMNADSQLPTETMNPLTLMGTSSNLQYSNRPASKTLRPGSDRHHVLPPIQPAGV